MTHIQPTQKKKMLDYVSSRGGINYKLPAGREALHHAEKVQIRVPYSGKVKKTDDRMNPWWAVHGGGTIEKSNFKLDKVVHFGEFSNENDEDAGFFSSMREAKEKLKFQTIHTEHMLCQEAYDARLMYYLEYRYNSNGPFLTPNMYGTSKPTSVAVDAYTKQLITQDMRRSM
eukprot:Tbor_TRINITY_DN5337_c3_g4::TRINITY_DN5337_c3_g4_i2::g.4223::m.4223